MATDSQNLIGQNLVGMAAGISSRPRRVVVTGMGIASPLGIGIENVWRRLVEGESGIGRITVFDASDLPAQVAGEVPSGPTAEGGLTLGDWIPHKDQKKMDRFIHLGIIAAAEAVADSGWVPQNEQDREATGVMIGSGIGGLQSIYDASVQVHEGKARRLSPFFIPSALINLISGHVSIRFGFKGPNHSAVTACATGVHAIGDAARLIMLGDADVIVAGGAEAAVCALGIAGFCASRALSTSFNETPTKASRPWDKDRDGFVIGEGAGILILESLEFAQARGAKILGEVVGYGMSSDAFHMTGMAPGGEGCARSMKNAIRSAGLQPDEIDYVNAHATSTPLGDVMESKGMETVFGEHALSPKLLVSSTKSMTGHLLGGAGGLEAGITLMAMQKGIVPPTMNLDNVDPECRLNYVPNRPQEARLTYALSNSFGFGGTNGSLIFKRWEE